MSTVISRLSVVFFKTVEFHILVVVNYATAAQHRGGCNQSFLSVFFFCFKNNLYSAMDHEVTCVTIFMFEHNIVANDEDEYCVDTLHRRKW